MEFGSNQHVCAQHPGTLASATCARCGDFLCHACLAIPNPPSCARCAAFARAPRGRPLGVWVAEGAAIAWGLLCCCGLGSLVAFSANTGDDAPTVLLVLVFGGAMLVPVGAAVASIRRMSLGREVLLAFHGLAGPLLCCSSLGTVPQFAQEAGTLDGAMLFGQFLGGCLFPFVMMVASVSSAIYLSRSDEAKAWYAMPREPRR